MQKIKALLKKYRELILYVVFGGLTTLVNFVILKLCNMAVGEKFYLISNVVAWLGAVIFAYVTNKLFVFESKSWAPKVLTKEIISFAGARVLSLGIEEVGLWLLVDICKMDAITWHIFKFDIGGIMIAKLILAVVVVILNYIFSKLFIFKKNRSDNK
ncbi:MAG: GtrA family protein [Clostridia bacterium]|nr:GtrA family protein [Clostridia bacterium]